MKRAFLLSLIFILISSNLYCQPCLPQGITFTRQGQIDSFQINYSGCTEIEGDVSIGGQGINITSLNTLIVLTSIGGWLEIFKNDSLANLTGLHNLTYIGGDWMIMRSCLLACLAGLENLDSIWGSLRIGIINQSKLQQGMYIFELVIKDSRLREK